MPAQLHQPHRFLQPQPLDPLADVLFRNNPLRGLRIDLSFLRLLADRRYKIAHRRLLAT